MKTSRLLAGAVLVLGAGYSPLARENAAPSAEGSRAVTSAREEAESYGARIPPERASQLHDDPDAR